MTGKARAFDPVLSVAARCADGLYRTCAQMGSNPTRFENTTRVTHLIFGIRRQKMEIV